MQVTTRNGTLEPVSLDKIRDRIKNLCYDLDAKFVDPVTVASKVCGGIYNKVTTAELDELAAETAAHLSSEHPDYGRLAGRITVSALHKTTSPDFCETMERINAHHREGQPTRLTTRFMNTVRRLSERIQAVINYKRDFEYDYFGIRTLMRGYLMRVDNEVVERPQHMIMRVALAIHDGDPERAFDSYELMSQGFFTHATPTLFNAGTTNGQLSSCFLLTMQGDSIDGIFKTAHQTALISKGAGGVGLAVSGIRAKGSPIGNDGRASGLVPMLRVFNNTARYVDQGGGKRNGAFAIYIEPWHADIEDVLPLRKNHGAEEMRARDLFYALWVPDLFMHRVETDGMWSLMCPNECPGLNTSHGAAFNTIYTNYERSGKFRKQVKARDLWNLIVDTQIETGQPYMLYKDACNTKSNQQNNGTIQCSNLCTEIVQYTSPDDVAVCNLASVALNKFVTEDGKYDHAALHKVVRTVTRNLNNVIDTTYYPVEQARKSNNAERPIGIGVQGLADTFAMLNMPYASDQARQLNVDIFETIYHAAVTESVHLARLYGEYPNFRDSPAANGQLQFDLWRVRPLRGRYNWHELKGDVATFGMRNSLLVAPMPTATTAQILGNTESFEPFNSNMYVRRTLAGEFQVINKHLVHKLVELGLWSNDMRQLILAHNGSVQQIQEIPVDVRELYRTVWEIKGKTLVDMAADRGPYICQSQSFNVHMPDANASKLTSLHFATWKQGLKTGMYYLRTKAATDAAKFTVDARHTAAARKASNDAPVCEMNEGCETCSA